MIGCYHSWRWQEVILGVFGIDATFQGMSPQGNILLFISQTLSRGYAHLLFDKVNTGHHFCYRMLHLNPGVHFHKVEVPFCIN